MGADSKVTNVLISLHGIRDNGEWQDHLSELYMGRSESASLAESYKYGFFDLLKFLFPISRARQTASFTRDLNKLLAKLIDENPLLERVDLAAHSFGTHIIFNSLPKIESRQAALIGNVAFMSSVLPTRVDWIGAAVRSPQLRVTNFCSVNDWVLLINAALPLNSGIAGRVGFKNVFDGALLQQRFFRLGHGGYFDRKSDWLSIYCLSALLGDVVTIGTHRRPKYGDFFASFLGFTKGITTSVLLSLLLVGYTLLTADGVLRASKERAEVIGGAPRLTALVADEIERLVPQFPYSLLQRFQTFDRSEVQHLFSRLAKENNVVYARQDLAKPGTSVVVDAKTMDLYVGDQRGLRVLQPKIDALSLQYEETKVSDAPITELFGNVKISDEQGEVVAVTGTGTILALCKLCKGGVEEFPAPGLKNFTAIGRIGDGLVGVGNWDEQEAPTIILRTGTLLILSNDKEQWGVPKLRYGLNGHLIGSSKPTFFVGDFPPPFSQYSWVGDRNTFLVIRRSDGESLMVSRDSGDVAEGGQSTDGNAAIEMRHEQIRTGESRFADRHADAWHCLPNEDRCEPWLIPFRPMEPDDIWIAPFVLRGVLHIYANDNINEYCIRVATVSDGRLVEVADGATEVTCPTEDTLIAAAADTRELNVGDELLLHDGAAVGVIDNPAAFRRLRKVHTDYISTVDVRACADYFEGDQLLGEITVYAHDGMLFTQCAGSIKQFDHWGEVARAYADGWEESEPRYLILPIAPGNKLIGSVMFHLNELVIRDIDGSIVGKPVRIEAEDVGLEITPDATYVTFKEEGAWGWLKIQSSQEGTPTHGGKVLVSNFGIESILGFRACRGDKVRIFGTSAIGNSSTEARSVVFDGSNGQPLADTYCDEVLPTEGGRLSGREIGMDQLSAFILGGYDLRLDIDSGGPPRMLIIRFDMPELDVRSRARDFMRHVWNQ